MPRMALKRGWGARAALDAGVPVSHAQATVLWQRDIAPYEAASRTRDDRIIRGRGTDREPEVGTASTEGRKGVWVYCSNLSQIDGKWGVNGSPKTERLHS